MKPKTQPAPTKASTSKAPTKANKKAVIGKVPTMKKGGMTKSK